MEYDVVVIGGGPSGASAATKLAQLGRKVALIDRFSRSKPCGGAIPPRLIQDFNIPDSQLVAKITTARMISPTGRKVDIPIENGFVGMVDRADFDPFLRTRAKNAGADVIVGSFLRLERSQDDGVDVVFTDRSSQENKTIRTKYVIGADGARSQVAHKEIERSDELTYVIAYHEIIERPTSEHQTDYDPSRCDVIYDGRISPDFYGWVFPHGESASVGMGTGHSKFDLKKATAALRQDSGLDSCATLRKEGAPIPLKPLAKWDNGRDVLLSGDAAGVVAPSSGEGIYYAMMAGDLSANIVNKALKTSDASWLRTARKEFLKEHGQVFKVLGMMQNAYYRNDNRRERFVSLCHDVDVQKLTFEAYMNKKLVHARPMAHLKIGLKNMAHLMGLVSPVST